MIFLPLCVALQKVMLHLQNVTRIQGADEFHVAPGRQVEPTVEGSGWP